MAEEIEISISPTGQVTVRTIGIKGPKCVQAAEAVAKIIGQIESRELTSEYYEADQGVIQQGIVKQHYLG